MLKISLITVCFNSEKTIKDTLDSVSVQSYRNIEYIVIDGQSTDGTLKIIEKYQNIISCLVSEQDQGIYDAMNKGINLATGDVIGFINADDVLAHSDVVRSVAKTFNDDSLDACYSDLLYVNSNNLNKIIRVWKSSPFVSGAFASGWSPPHPTFYVKKSVYEKNGVFDLQYKMGNDVELMMRFMERYHIKTQYVSDVWVKMRVGGVSNQSLGHIILQNKEIIRAAKLNQIPFSIPGFVFGKILDRFKQYTLNFK